MIARAFKILNLVLLLAVYVSFFAVQLLFNAGANTQQSRSYTHHYIEQAHKEGSQKITLSAASATKSIKKNIRLNKRFQPVSMPSMAYAVVAPFPVYITTAVVSKPVDYLLIASILTDSLRGPPVTA